MKVWFLPYAHEPQGETVSPRWRRSWPAQQAAATTMFRVNYAFDPALDSGSSAPPTSLPAASAAASCEGKTVIVGLPSERLGDQFMLPGWGKASGVYLHIIGAETLKAGSPIDLGWVPGFLACRRCWSCWPSRGRAAGPGRAMLGGGALLLLAVPDRCSKRCQIFADITPGLFVILLGRRPASPWQRYRSAAA